MCYVFEMYFIVRCASCSVCMYWNVLPVDQFGGRIARSAGGGAWENRRVGACALKVFCGVCFGESVVGVHFGVGCDVTVTRFVLINIRTVLMTGPFYVTGEVITILL